MIHKFLTENADLLQDTNAILPRAINLALNIALNLLQSWQLLMRVGPFTLLLQLVREVPPVVQQYGKSHEKYKQNNKYKRCVFLQLILHVACHCRFFGLRKQDLNKTAAKETR